MRMILLAFLAMAVISVAAYYGLQFAGFSAAEQAAGEAVRL